MKLPHFLRLWTGAVIIGCCGVRAAENPLDDIPGSAVMPPRLIEGPLPKKIDGEGVKVGIWIREDGTVEDTAAISGSESYFAEVVSLVKRWRFEPVQWEGKPIPARVEAIVRFGGMGPVSIVQPLPNLPGEIHAEDEYGLTNPVLKVDPEIILPLSAMVDRRRIKATLSYIVNEEGKPSQITPLAASSEEALRVALDNIAERTYLPGAVRGKPVKVTYTQTVGFASIAPPIDSLRGALDVVTPCYPYARLLANEEGSATVRFTLNQKGEVVSSELVEASHPDFGSALIAAVESWIFSETTTGEQNVREYRHEFLFGNTPYAARRLLAEIRGGKPVSSSPAGLEQRPELQGRPALVYPRALLAGATSGTASIEFVIDRTGLAQLPRVLDASDPAFGWAAVTCVNGMRFKPLTRHGKPAELRVVFPFKFVPPKPAENVPAG